MNFTSLLIHVAIATFGIIVDNAKSVLWYKMIIEGRHDNPLVIFIKLATLHNLAICLRPIIGRSLLNAMFMFDKLAYVRRYFGPAYQRYYAMRAFHSNMLYIQSGLAWFYVYITDVIVRVVAGVLICKNWSVSIVFAISVTCASAASIYMARSRIEEDERRESRRNSAMTQFVHGVRHSGFDQSHVRTVIKNDALVCFRRACLNLIPNVILTSSFYCIAVFFANIDQGYGAIAHMHDTIMPLTYMVIETNNRYEELYVKDSRKMTVMRKCEKRTALGKPLRLVSEANIESITIRDMECYRHDKTREFMLRARNIELTRDKPTLLTSASGSGKTTFAGLFCDGIKQKEIRKFECILRYADGQSEQIDGVDAVITLSQICFHFEQEQTKQPETPIIVRDWLNGASAERQEELLRMMRVVGLKFDLDSKIGGGKCSPGEWSRFLLAHNIVTHDMRTARIIVFDEPFGTVDAETTKRIMQYIADLARNAIMIVISHDVHMHEAIGENGCAYFDINTVEESKVLGMQTRTNEIVARA